ncbi:MAG: cysteine desulfurase [Candidatus Puniceispirillum sp.]|nr:cysteine desulfurase [Candidatus Pelagibacter sp.]MBA4283124.1 cysteine desulfurase [Candidatus Puniceispirillum sp.]
MICSSSPYIYLDYNASVPVRKQCFENLKMHDLNTLNPSAIHDWGRKAKYALESSRDILFNLLEISRVDYEIIFTSGATEVNNSIIQSFDGPILVSSVEHSSVLNAKPSVDILSVDTWGRIDLGDLENWLSKQSRPSLVCIMHANNETGVVQDVQAVSNLCKKYNTHFHCDAVQVLGKRKIDFSLFSSCALSAHKIGGFGGIGCCVIKKNWELPAFLKGGGQEQYRRAGTENLVGAISFAVALEKAIEEQHNLIWQDVDIKRNRLESMILDVCPDVYIAGKNLESDQVDRLENTTMICLPGVKSERQVVFMDLYSIGVSAGSACSSGSLKDSHVLKAMKVPDHLSMGSLRVSMGPYVSDNDLNQFFHVWCKMAEKFGAIIHNNCPIV